MNRAYSVLTVKSVQEDQRTITGVATTPETDRQGDIVESLGIKFKNPMPLLHNHRSDEPVGTVTFDKPTKNGITYKAQLPFIAEPGPLKDRVDTAWGEIKSGLVRGVSIGFRPIEYSFMDDGGVRFLESEVLELSLVAVPANASATIQTFKSIDAPLLAATGKEPKASDRPTPPAPGKSKSVQIQAKEAKGTMTKKTIAEQISAFEATRQAKAAEMDSIMEVSAEKGETLDAEQTEKYDGLATEVKSIDEHLVRLRAHEATNKAAAVAVTEVKSVEDGSKARGGVSVVQVRDKNLPKGIGFTRFVIANARAKGNIMLAHEIAKGNEQWKSETPEVEMMLKTAVTSGSTSDTTFASPLVNYQVLTQEFVEYLRPLSIIGRLQGLTRVPFKVRIQRQTGASTVNWVGEGAPKPLTSSTFDSITLDFAKIAGIIVLNDELVRLSSPSAEMLVRDDLAKSIVQFMDNQFVDPSKAAVSGVSPASITNGVSPVTATGTTGAALRADLKSLFASFLAANMQVTNASFIMTQQTALAISLMTNSLGNPEFPNITMNGGTLLGLPVITSENIPATGGSPTDGYPIILVSTPDILLADDGDITIDASREASLQMDTAPDSPATASTVMVSMFQQNMTAIRAERYLAWAKRRSSAVAYIQNARYFE
ncbi:phage major capsid protein (plasmid) [Bradyrhizobium elkanii]|uniref:phage major capsid protein n=1 Tax=Bradyrhizobium elkanii TaxID=29448 RepID=UPI002714A9E1|nr:phage major capsid protein [Bradyrhizobium elkanii]WLB14813.1 phage major capsid protein [Bradyrhizobium elkanii]WLB69096.1 phage major capsid protein [Bradyrhizobium elkanii]